MIKFGYKAAATTDIVNFSGDCIRTEMNSLNDITKQLDIVMKQINEKIDD